MDVTSLFRRGALLLAVAVVVAGCATPAESGPEDRHQDGDQDGIPDGNSPDPWSNETDEEIGENKTGLDAMPNETA